MKQLRTRMILFVAKENTLKRIFKIWFLLALLGLHCVPVSAALAELYWPVRYENGTSNTSIGTNNGENGHRGIDIIVNDINNFTLNS